MKKTTYTLHGWMRTALFHLGVDTFLQPAEDCIFVSHTASQFETTYFFGINQEAREDTKFTFLTLSSSTQSSLCLIFLTLKPIVTKQTYYKHEK